MILQSCSNNLISSRLHRCLRLNTKLHMLSWPKSAFVWEVWHCPRLDLQEKTIAHYEGSPRTVIACRESMRHLACWQQKWFSDTVFSDCKQWKGGRTFLTDWINGGHEAKECCISCLDAVLQFSRLIFKQHGPWARAEKVFSELRNMCSVGHQFSPVSSFSR